MGTECLKSPEKPQKTLRNGLDFVPKKTYPPDYSNVPDVRSWQMSPFSKERFDLNEIQIMEKKGIKYKDQLEELKKKFSHEKKEEKLKVEKVPECPKCLEREKAESKCDANYLYQPYGPSVMSTVSYREVGIKKNKLFCVSPRLFSDFKVDNKRPDYVKTPLSCKEFGNRSLKSKDSKGYIPYGPLSKRAILFSYVPMGPLSKPVHH